MRTTLDIDPDILEAAKEISARTRRTAGQVLSDLARSALSTATPPRSHNLEARNGFEVIPAGNRVITSELVERLAEESES